MKLCIVILLNCCKGSKIIFSADGGKLTVITKDPEICVRRHFIVDPKVKIAFVMHMADFESVLNEFAYGVIEVKENRIILTIADTNLERLTMPFTDVSEPEFPSDIKNETSITPMCLKWQHMPRTLLLLKIVRSRNLNVLQSW